MKEEIAMKYQGIREEELKNRVAQDFFGKFDCTEIIRDIDFSVRAGEEYLVWAEAKSKTTDVEEMLTQLVLTIGKARTFDRILPPPFLGCFDNEKIAFISFSEVQDIFHQNDFNWKVAPSDYKTKEFEQVYAQVAQISEGDIYLFDFENDEEELKQFIKDNFTPERSGATKTKIDKNNFITIYNKWLETVKPTIMINWEIAKKKGIYDRDFYLADLLSQENMTIKDKLSVLLKLDHYELDRKLDELGLSSSSRATFKDNQKAHTRFWTKYDRPPLQDYWNYIVERQDLLVPQDVRERKGSFFTPKIWVELSQKYLADVFGENWQDEYYIWDCAAGTGNLLAGLINKYNIWASTIDKADVDVMHDRIANGANLLDSHVFQFDFLNDDFSKLPKPLQDIINDEGKRKKLIVYINPPYAEAASTCSGNAKTNVSNISVIYDRYSPIMGKAFRELFIQFLYRIYKEIPGCKIGEFSKLKALNSSNFSRFRKFFTASLEKMFIVPSDTFDNVTGDFPIGFKIWDTAKNKVFKQISSDVFDAKGKKRGKKKFFVSNKSINNWLKNFTSKSNGIAELCAKGTDFQNSNYVNIAFYGHLTGVGNSKGVTKFNINLTNLIPVSIYLAVRHCIKRKWLNDRDQFLYPNDNWKTDLEFQNDCLCYTLFSDSNNISAKHGVNHWIPFTEYEVGARDKFSSDFMTKFIAGKIEPSAIAEPLLFYISNGGRSPAGSKADNVKREFSEAATAVFNAGRDLWSYYHKQPNIDVNAAFYDIREYFQERGEKGNMNKNSNDETYNDLIGKLRVALKNLAKKIEPKVYEYGFLKE
ncbi:MAG: hypothetical protein LBM75_04340 [Myxococcales bacterium]|nr:hypothetical protein [Myxococcales bacterium]